jgi:hypothetical protein
MEDMKLIVTGKNDRRCNADISGFRYLSEGEEFALGCFSDEKMLVSIRINDEFAGCWISPTMSLVRTNLITDERFMASWPKEVEGARRPLIRIYASFLARSPEAIAAFSAFESENGKIEPSLGGALTLGAKLVKDDGRLTKIP